MFSEIQDLIFDGVFTENNHKIKETDNLNDYLSDFKNYDLTCFALLQVWVNNNYKDLFKIRNLENRPKKYILDYINSNLKDILEAYIQVINEDDISYLKKLVSYNGSVKYTIDDFNMSLHFILLLKNFLLAKVYYNKKENIIHFYMPKEFVDIFKVALNDKDLISINKRNNKIVGYIEGILEAYGIISLSKLHEIFQKQMFKISIDELNKVISANAMIDGQFHIYRYNDDTLVGGVEFDEEDEALIFYENLKGKYHVFSKDEYNDLKECLYIKKLDSYKIFVKYLLNNYDGIYQDLDDIYMFLISDYTTTAQFSTRDADRDFINKLSKMFETTPEEKNTMLKMMHDIFKEYPKWNKRGNK